jgi:thioredoxin 1
MKILPTISMGVVAALAVSLAGALEIEPFSGDSLAQAQRAGAPVALHFHSQWCGTCKLQDLAFREMQTDPGLPMKLLVVDFDEDLPTSRAFRVPASGAVIVFRGQVERARSFGILDRKQLRDVLRKAF